MAIIILVTGTLTTPRTYAGGGHHRHGHGYHHGYNYHQGNSFNIGLGFVFTPFIFGYPYYAPAPVYTYPVGLPPGRFLPGQPSYNVNEGKPAYCREYSKRILVDGNEEMAYGTACLQDNGSWRIMN